MSIGKILRKEEEKIVGKIKEEIEKTEKIMLHPEYEKLRHIPHPPKFRKEALQKVFPFIYALNAANVISVLAPMIPAGTRVAGLFGPETLPILAAGAQVPAVIAYYETIKEQRKAHEAWKNHLEYEKRTLLKKKAKQII